MGTKLLHYSKLAYTSFWFIPGFMVLAATILSFVSIYIDMKISFDFLGIFGVGGGDESRAILSTIASSAIGVAGVAFSITIVVLVLASSQFGPRLLRGYMRDRGNQIVLGTFISTFIYCLLLLRSVGAVEALNFSITIAVIMSMFNVGMFIYFIHHISSSIHVDHIISIVYKDLLAHIKNFLPEESTEISIDNFDENEEQEEYSYTLAVKYPSSGYLQVISRKSILNFTKKNNFLVHIMYKPGEFIVENSPLLIIKSNEEIQESISKDLLNYFIVGKRRISEQDPEFAIHQIVEIAVRALSPGINDPFTALTCIDWLGSVVCLLTNKQFPVSKIYDEESKLRMVSKTSDFKGAVNVAFDQIRQYGVDSVAVNIRLLETLSKIAIFIKGTEQKDVIQEQADMILRSSEKANIDIRDKTDIKKRYDSFLKEINS
ncbi:MAG: Unknown protein [uncultured Campylobacterales bacterium]|uniref:DUF2254 domain-containing protein n=1 Tax=uncultured Campylobacterales bacterium TaxID=352960 RepID=A0A6S6SRM0_9BACT|nr:MAG: Unknown protein [uncultured Campylobacterales bacterium]